MGRPNTSVRPTSENAMGSMRTDTALRPAPRILVVEDEALIAMDLEVRLMRLGYDVVGTADNYEEAIGVAVGTEPDLVLMDIRIRGARDGIDTATALRDISDVPVVFLTSHSDDATIAATERASPYGYVLKPFDERTLVATVETALQRHAHEREFRLFSTAVETATVGILLVDLMASDGPRIISANDAFLALSGRHRDQVIEQRPCFLARSPADDAVRRLRQAFTNGERAKVEIEGLRPDGSVFWTRVTLSPFNERGGRPSHMLMFHEDVTTLRSTEASLSALQQLELQSWAISSFKHEFNNMLSVIASNASLIVEPDTDDFVRAGVEDILTAARRGAALVEQLDDLGRPEPRLHVCDAGQIVRGSQSALRRILGHTTRLRIEGPSDPLQVAIAPSHLQQALVIVVRHLRETSLSGRGLILRLRSESSSVGSGDRKGFVCLEIHATSPVESAEARDSRAPLDAQFEDGFDRVAFARRLFERAGGSLQIEVQPQGSLFASLRLPEAVVDSPLDEAPLPETVRGVVEGDLCILVQDDPALRRATARVLTEMGFDVRACAAPNAAVDVAGRLREDIDLLILDVTSPGIAFAELLRNLRAIRPVHEALLIRGAGSGGADDGLNDSDADVIWKPYSSMTLARAVIRLTTAQDAVSDRTAPASEPWTGSAPSTAQTVVQPRRRRTSIESGMVVRQPATVLIVEDEEPSRRAMALALRREGFLVETAEGLRAGLQQVETLSRIDLCICDIGLPDGSGFELAERLRERHPRLPFLVVSGSESAEQLRQSLRVRASAHLAKPLDMELFLREVRDAIAEGELQRLQSDLLSARLGRDVENFVAANSDIALSEALASLRMAFQPIVRASDGLVMGYEALMRPSGGGFTSPPSLLNAAEILDRIEEVGRVTRGLIAEALQNRPAMSSDVYVNLHPLELREDLLLAASEPLLAHAGRVVLEVTERAQFGAEQDVVATLEALRREGFRIAVDDLGAGYAGLSWLLRMRPDIAKLDMSLIRGIDQSSTQRRLVASLVNFCRRSEIRVLAEGIETAEESAILTDLGCELLQGYHFGRPALDFAVVAPQNGVPG